MDYEKKYNEALKWMRELYPGLHGATKEDAEHYFPELRESEDERIRTFLIDYFTSYKIGNVQTKLNGVKIDDIIAYLEKQKEQKSTEKQDYSGLTDLERAIHRGFLSAGVENVPVTIIKQTAKECLAQMKPAEWSEEDELMRTVIIQTLEKFGGRGTTGMQIAWLKSLHPSWKPSEEQMKALEVAFRKDGDDEYRNIINSLYNDLKRL